jgi:hypothetical protein
MVGHGTKFSQKMEQAVAALLSCRTVEEAARAAGVGTNTLRRWMKQPEFEAALREARTALLSQAVARLQGASNAAATTILKIMLSPDAPAGARLRAAEIVLEQAAKASSVEDFEARLADLERKAGSKKSSRRSTGGIALLKAMPASDPSQAQARSVSQLDTTVSNKEGEE